MKQKVLLGCLVGVLLSLYSYLPYSKSSIRNILKDSVVYIIKDSSAQSGGTGFMIRNDAGREYLITNKHVCKGTKDEKGDVLVQLEDGTQIKRHIIEMAPKTDLCLIEPVPGMPALKMARSEVSINDHLWVLGHPYLAPETLVDGDVISIALIDMLDHLLPPGDEDAKKCDGKIKDIEFFFLTIPACMVTYKSILTSVVIYPGNSGSPVVNDWGKVVGVIFAGDGRTNYGAALTGDQVRDFINKY